MLIVEVKPMNGWNQRKIITLVGVVVVSLTVFAAINLQKGASIAFGLLQHKSIFLASDVKADYSKLQNLLQDKEWRDADDETTRLMFSVAHKDKQG